jgi:hypothetical protein
VCGSLEPPVRLSLLLRPSVVGPFRRPNRLSCVRPTNKRIPRTRRGPRWPTAVDRMCSRRNPSPSTGVIERSAEHPDTAGCWRRFVRRGMLPDIEPPRDRRDGAIAHRNPIGSSRPGLRRCCALRGRRRVVPIQCGGGSSDPASSPSVPSRAAGFLPHEQRAPVRQRAVRGSRARRDPRPASHRSRPPEPRARGAARNPDLRPIVEEEGPVSGQDAVVCSTELSGPNPDPRPATRRPIRAEFR